MSTPPFKLVGTDAEIERPHPAPSPAKDPRDTPAMRQYYQYKKAHPGCILLFRIGDFYEMFDDDAVTASRAIGLTLTQRAAGVPMAGVPYHQLDNYLRKFINAGFRVAVCDQTQDAAEAKGLVERAVTRVLTPGTLIDDALLADDQTAAIACVCFPYDNDATVAMAVAELSTGELTLLSCPASQAADELVRRGVTELLFPQANTDEPPPRVRAMLDRVPVAATPQPQWSFRHAEAREATQELFKVKSLQGFGIRDDDPLIAPCGALIRYLQATQAPDGSGTRLALRHLRPPRLHQVNAWMQIDAASLRSLEIDRTIRGGGALRGDAATAIGGEGSLLGIFSGRSPRATAGSSRVVCRTPMGKRLVREYLCRPLCDLKQIEARQSCVATLVEDRRLAKELGDALQNVQDVQRIGARVALGRATPRDIVALGASLAAVRAVGDLLQNAPAFNDHRTTLELLADDLEPLADQIAESCVSNPPAHLRDGGLVRDGVDAALDEARNLKHNAAGWLAQYQAELVDTHQLPNLKVGYNKVFGYYIELPKAQAQRAPAAFSRRQTLTNAERYVTQELKEFEDRASTADARALQREQAIFDELCAEAGAILPSIARFGETCAALDVLLCFADKAAIRGWKRPSVVDAPVLHITQGRHPVLDELLAGEFVPNDTELGIAGPDGVAPSLALITGPNMAGKSTFIRQVALITLLAHTGSFVPAEAATIGLTDRIFTRVGADDALFAGQSTFMVEMTETANILHYATPRSLIVLDEIGRGTSTLDGLSLAWAIAESLAVGGAKQQSSKAVRQQAKNVEAAGQSESQSDAASGPRTLFATHYHELTQLQELLAGRATNLHVAVRELDDQIVFLHRILPGRTDRSYGLHVARLAGIPERTIKRAGEVLESLTVEHSGATQAAARSESAAHKHMPPPAQMGLFTEYLSHPVVDELRQVKLETLSPMQAFDLLRELAQKAAKDR